MNDSFSAHICMDGQRLPACLLARLKEGSSMAASSIESESEKRRGAASCYLRLS
jgi:hypothetical protein